MRTHCSTSRTDRRRGRQDPGAAGRLRDRAHRRGGSASPQGPLSSTSCCHARVGRAFVVPAPICVVGPLAPCMWPLARPLDCHQVIVNDPPAGRLAMMQIRAPRCLAAARSRCRRAPHPLSASRTSSSSSRRSRRTSPSPTGTAFQKKYPGTKVEVQNRNTNAAVTFIRETRRARPTSCGRRRRTPSRC